MKWLSKEKINEHQVSLNYQKDKPGSLPGLIIQATTSDCCNLTLKRKKSFSIEKFNDFEELKKHKNIRVIKNMTSLDFVTKNAGKEKAIEFLIQIFYQLNLDVLEMEKMI